MTIKEKIINTIGKEVMRRNGMCYISCYYRGRSHDNHFLVVRVGVTLEHAKKQGYEDISDKGLERGWEVWKVREPYANSFTNKWGLNFPTNEEFGLYGWSYQDYENAKKRLEELK